MCDYTFLQQTEGSKWWDRPPQQYILSDQYGQCLLGVGGSCNGGTAPSATMFIGRGRVSGSWSIRCIYLQRGKAIPTWLGEGLGQAGLGGRLRDEIDLSHI